MCITDIDRICAIYIENEMTKSIQNYQSIEDEKVKLRAYINNVYKFFGYGLWALIEKETDFLVGECGIQNRKIDGIDYYELEYVIGKQNQGKGYATEACYFVLEYLKNNLQAEQVIAVINRENRKSIHLIKKIGFDFVKEINSQEQLYLHRIK